MLALGAVGFLLLTVLPSAVVLGVGMIPTMAALAVDRTRGKYLARCVAPLNLAGVAPYIGKLWAGSNNLAQAVSIVSDVFAWFVIYSAAGLGWLMFLGVPTLAISLQSYTSRRKMRSVRDKQKELIDEWGDSVTSTTKAAAMMPPERAEPGELAETEEDAPEPADRRSRPKSALSGAR